MALQAQQPGAAHVALWNRLVDLDPAAVDGAFTAGEVVKATLMRITLHAVHAGDHQPWLTAMLPTLRASRLNDKRFAKAQASVAEVDAWMDDLLAFTATPRTAAEVQAWMGEHTTAEAQWLWWAVKSFAAWRRVPGDGPWAFGQDTSVVSAGFAQPTVDEAASDVALAGLIARYLAAFGPATVADIGRFALVPRGRVRRVLPDVDDLVTLIGPDAVEYLDVAGAPRPDDDVPAPPRLLGMWDQVLLAFDDRTRVIDDDHRGLVIRRNGDTLATLWVDGRVVGVWRTADDGIQASAFVPLPDDAWDGLASEAAALQAWLADRHPHPFGRYDHWWKKGIPAHETRLLSPG